MPFPWLAGMRVTAGRLQEHVPIYVVKQEAEDRTSTTTLADDAELVISLPEGTWEVQMSLELAGTSGSEGVRTAWRIGGDAVMDSNVIKRVLGPSSGSTNRLDTQMRSAIHNETTTVTYGATGGTGARAHAWEMVHVVVGPAGGEVALQWAQAVSHADISRVANGSFVRAARIA